MEKHLAALYGGTKVVEILTGQPPDPNDPNLNLLDVGSDADQQNDLIHRLAAEEDGQLEVSGRALELAERILHDNWSNVRKVVDRLLLQDELIADQFAAILATEDAKQ
jgi:hypothetical protein